MNFQTLLDPPILFFCLGVIGVILKSNIEVPPNTTKFLSYYLLMSIGFKGGMALSHSEMSSQIAMSFAAGIMMAVLVPIWVYFVLKTRLDNANAAGAAACYGSVSAVTFIAGTSWLENQKLTYGGHIVALMPLMECTAIITGLLIAKLGSKEKTEFKLLPIIHDALFNGSVYLLLGSLVIGYVAGPSKTEGFQVFVYDMFKGFLSFFLLDLGITAAKQVKQLKGDVMFIGLVTVLAPLINGLLGLFLAQRIGLHTSDGFIFIILCASSSYIAVPAALKMALPEAKTGIYLSMSLGLTFPFNLLIGLPIYWSWAATYLTN